MAYALCFSSDKHSDFALTQYRFSNSNLFVILVTSFMPPVYRKREVKLQHLFMDNPLVPLR